MRLRHLIAIALLAFFAAVSARAETCNAPTYANWSAAASGGWTGSPCTPGSGDDFIIGSGSEVVVSALLTFNSGTTNVTCQSGGKIRFQPGAGFNWTGGAGGKLVTEPGCIKEAGGAVLGEYRLGSEVTYAAGPPATGAFTAIGGGAPNGVAATSDYLYWSDDWTGSVTAAISSVVQTVTGIPLAGYFRPSYMSETWSEIQALSATGITYYTNPWADVDGGTAVGTAATSPFGGTRGPALTSSTALSGNVRVKGGRETKLQIDLNAGGPAGAGPVDGDLASQYVVFQSGACSGKRAKIVYVDSNASPTADDIYVKGDVAYCGLANITIDFGARLGDPVKLVRPVIFNGGNVAHVEFRGGTIRGEWIVFRNMAPYTESGSSNPCTICFIKHAAGASPPTGYLRHVLAAYHTTATAGTDTAVIGPINMNTALTNYLRGTGETFDLSGFDFSHWNIRDQRLNSAGGTCPGSCNGLHGILSTSSQNVRADWFRVERIGDDGAVFVSEDWNQGTGDHFRLRHWRIFDLFVTAGSNSQQCLDLNGGTSSTTQITRTRGEVQDILAIGCSNGTINWKLLASKANRIIAVGGGAPSAGGYAFSANIAGYSALGTSAYDTYPNRITNALIDQSNPTNNALGADIGGALEDSIVGGNYFAGGDSLRDVTAVRRSLVDLGSDQTDGLKEFINRANTQAYARTVNIGISDSIFLNSSANYKTLSASNINQAPYAVVNILRSIFAQGQISSGWGWAWDDTSDNMTITANHLRLASITATNGGMRGGSTGNGARVTNTCVETDLTTAPTQAYKFGTSRTASSIELGSIKPDAGDDVPLAAWLARVSPVCDPPQRVGLAQVGIEASLLGDGFLDSLDAYTSRRELLRTLGTGSGGGGSMLEPTTLEP